MSTFEIDDDAHSATPLVQELKSARADELGDMAVDLLREFIRIPSVNDPERLSSEARQTKPWEAGREAEAAAWIVARLCVEGIEAEALEAAPGRVNVVARLYGRGRGQAVTLLSHSDVVPATRSTWSYDPFGGEVHDGYIYGRGALDLKGLCVVQMLTLIQLRRARIPLERDVVLLVVADEETGGRFGAEWILAQRPDLLDSDVVLGEGAYSVSGFLPNGEIVHAIAVGEKGYLELELLVEASGGHGSIPAPDNAPRRLVAALDRILSMGLPLRLTPVTRALLRRLAGGAPGLHGRLLASPALLRWFGSGVIKRSALLNAMVCDTLAATVLEAGDAHNALPAQARAVLSIRVMPESNVDALEARINGIARRFGVHTRRVMQKAANRSPLESAAIATIERVLAEGQDGAVVVPLLSPAASDCRFFRARGIPSFGWIPFVIPSSDLNRVHGADERVSIAALKQGVVDHCAVVSQLATSAQVNGGKA
ncbi:M20/M25/M40 family metallo-hydrolase [Bradyrhizobium sp. Ai1a-2]|uniref:M20/M25/M40 family metallo-hydrolase n=1 Tax=Bradyrhizobium sp. Ai1a-2 TaxID=196490 RepID=UPI000423872C|nr:M20/M25/M40 family metallo-hydrolase [Bradyrhizobium sp. Ai1a-2]